MSLEASVAAADTTSRDRRANGIAFAVMVALIVIAPFVAYPFFITVSYTHLTLPTIYSV